MRLTNIKDVQKFIDVVNSCEHEVYLKSSMSQYIAIGRLIQESGSSLELFANDKNDQIRLINFLHELNAE